MTFPAEFCAERRSARVFGRFGVRARDVSGPGYWVFAPARLPGSSIVVVNRGFIPDDQKAAAEKGSGGGGRISRHRGGDSAGRKRATPSRLPTIRTPTSGSPATPLRWRKPRGGAGSRPFTWNRKPRPRPCGWPRPGRLEPRLPNNHLQYALTWYGLAAALLGVLVFWARGRLRAPPGLSATRRP